MNEFVNNSTYVSSIAKSAKQIDLEILNLAEIEKNPLLLLKPRKIEKAPNILVAAGFHGDEPASCYGVSEFLRMRYKEYEKTLNISFLPLVNPSGFLKGTRFNFQKKDPNRGFCHTISGKPELSFEGQILLNNMSQLLELASDGFLSLHEDVEEKLYYLYTFEHLDEPGDFSKMLALVESNFFDPHPDGELEGGMIRNGIIFNHCDGSFEDLLFHKGVPRAACTETPGLLDLNTRIKVNYNLIDSFASFCVSLER